MSVPKRIPVLLDTDIGDDIDDSLTLAYLLNKPECELLGVTTVTGRDPRERAALASAICRAAGRNDIPIHSGASCRMRDGGVMAPNVCQLPVLDQFDHRPVGDFASNTAVHFLQETINARPGEITLLVIGPTTNIGLLFALDPEIPRKLKKIVLMCGHFGACNVNWNGQGFREYNALCDPFATHIVYRSPVAEHLSVGLDVTANLTMSSLDCVTPFNLTGGPSKVVSAMIGTWVQKFGCETVGFHDPLAATMIFKPEICSWQQGQVTVELASTRFAGLTIFDRKDADGSHRIASSVSAQAFFDEYFGSACPSTSTAFLRPTNSVFSPVNPRF